MEIVDLEAEQLPANIAFDAVIVGGGAAGLTIAKDLARLGLRIGILESGGIEQSPQHEALNEVVVEGGLLDPQIQSARASWHGHQLPFWSSERQGFGVRCRVLGGSTAGWAGKVAPFDAIDFQQRDWIANSGWPIDASELEPFVEKAAGEMDLGPVLDAETFWEAAAQSPPDGLNRLQCTRSFFWQFARSTRSLSDVKRFGPDFLSEAPRGITVVINATVTGLAIENGAITEVRFKSTLTGKASHHIATHTVVLAAGAIENARMLLSARDEAGRPVAPSATGHYLMDHPAVRLGTFSSEGMQAAGRFFGFFSVLRDARAFIYAHGLALKPDCQTEQRLPNVAMFGSPTIAEDDPLISFARLVSGKSNRFFADLRSVLGSPVHITLALGRKIVEHPKVPRPIRRAIADLTILLNSNLVAKSYASKGKGRKLQSLDLEMISEQPPAFENRVTLSDEVDRLGIPKAKIRWEMETGHKDAMLRSGQLIIEEIQAAGLKGFQIDPAFARAGATPSTPLVTRDMAHTAGTTRMHPDPGKGVVDRDCKVHGVEGLYVAGASVFPTSGHANPTLMILALALRLSRHLGERLREMKVQMLEAAQPSNDNQKETILVTGATGNLGGEVIKALREAGYRVVAQYRNRVPQTPGVVWRKLDFANAQLKDADFHKLAEGVDAVIHLAGSQPDRREEMEVTNVRNLERFAAVCAAQGVRYFGQASSMVVYGSPKKRLVTEDAPLIERDPGKLREQYRSDMAMRDYARSKMLGEAILRGLAGQMRVELYRIAVAQRPEFLAECQSWSLPRRLFSEYRNSHFISSRNAARAMVHLLIRSLQGGKTGVEAYNICDRNSPTFRQVRAAAGVKSAMHVPLMLDLAKSTIQGRSLRFRYPHGAFRMDNAKLLNTGFAFEDTPPN